MVRTREQFSTRTVADFSKDLSKHQRESALFFDSTLLKIIEERFGYNLCNIIFYNENFEFQAITAKMGLTEDPICVSEHPYRYFCKKNPVFHTINRYFQSHASSDPDTPLLFHSTDIIPKTEYNNSEYARYLNRAGCHYGVMLPFGPNGSYRLCIHKAQGDHDFSDIELNLLQSVYLMVAGSYASFNSLRELRTASRVKSTAMDAQQTGSILLDGSMRIVDCNESASRYLCSMIGCTSLEEAKTGLISRLRNRESISGGSLETVINDYHIFMQSHSEGPAGSSAYHSIIIRPPKGYAGQSRRNPLSLLTFREMEIVEKLAKGLTYQQVSEELYITLSTVRNHVQNIFKKLDISNQRQLILLYMKNQDIPS